MAKLTVEQWVEKTKKTLEGNLRSVVLYGSAAAGDASGALSDTNVLVVVERLGVDDLRSLADATSAWVRQGNPPPVFLTAGEIAASADVFPIEYSDLGDSRKVLFGEDPFASLVFSTAHLRVELEHEFRGAVLRLRRSLVASGMDRKAVGEVMLKSLTTFLVLLRSAVRLTGEKPPLKKTDALAILKGRVSCDLGVLEQLDEARRNQADPRDVAERLDAYLTVLDALAVWIDRGAGAAE